MDASCLASTSLRMVASTSFLVPNLRLLLAVLGVRFETKLTILVHVQPFSLDRKFVCSLPSAVEPIYRRTQSHAQRVFLSL